jgi:hypothetical protein
MIPGTHPIRVQTKTIRNEPHPLSATANGGNSTHKIARVKLTCLKFRIKCIEFLL